MRTALLSEVAQINPRGDRVSDEEEISFVGMADLSAETGVAGPGMIRRFSEVSKGYTVFRDHDLLVAKITPCFENGKIGQARLYRTIGAGSTEFHVVRPNPKKLNDRYALHFLRQDWIRKSGELRMTGSAGQRRVPAAFLAGLELPLPPIEEQRRIAAILDHADGILSQGRAIITQLRGLRSDLFNHHFGAPSTWSNRWSMGSIGDVTAEARYGTSSKASASGAYPVLRMGNLTYDGQLDRADLKYIDLREDEVTRYTVRRGDILFNRTNSAELVGKTAVVTTDEPFVFAGYLVRLRLTEGNEPEFVSGYLNSSYGKAVLRGMCKSIVGQANINAREMQSIHLPLPPPTAQLAYSKDVAAVQAHVEIALRRQHELTCLFGSLQARAFSGRL